MSDMPVVVTVAQAGMAPNRYYGPFASLDEANKWMAAQPEGVRFHIIWLRPPDSIRTFGDFFDPNLDDPTLDGRSPAIVYHG